MVSLNPNPVNQVAFPTFLSRLRQPFYPAFQPFYPAFQPFYPAFQPFYPAISLLDHEKQILSGG